MTASFPIQATFSRGEISPLLQSKVDADFWKLALERCINFGLLIHGGLRRRSGTRFVAPVANSLAYSRLMPFTFSNEQSYVLDVNGAGDIQFLAERGYVELAGEPYATGHSWGEAEIPFLSYAQFNDVAYFGHRGFVPYRLSRFAETSWTVEVVLFEDGPYLPENTTTTTLTPASTGGAVPLMTTNTAPAGMTASSTDGGADSFKAFDGNHETSVEFATTGVGYVRVDLGAAVAKVVDAYWLQAPASYEERMPTAWVFEGSNDGATWVIEDRVENEVGWNPSEIRYFEFKPKSGYRYFQFRFTGGGAVDPTDGVVKNSTIARIVLHESALLQTAFNLTASSTTGINGGAGFVATDVGRPIHLLGTDGKWRWAQVIARSSSTVVTVRLFGHALPDLTPILRWQLGAFSASSGYPALVELYNERLVWGRTDVEPLGVWGSRLGVFTDYGVSDPLQESDAFSISLLSSSMNELTWLAGDEDLVAGSAKQIRSILPADITKALSATNITQRKGPQSGATKIEPLQVAGTLLYVAAGETKIRELVLSDQNRYVAPELSLIGEHFFAAGIEWWCFSENPDPVIYVGTEAGEVIAILYDREQRVVGFSTYQFSNGFAESGCVIPSPVAGYDDLYLSIRRTINGEVVRYIEVLERPFDHTRDQVEDGFFVDCGLTYEGDPVTVISGMDHLEGQQVVALADGAVVRMNDTVPLSVIDGSVTLPYAASKVHIGLAYQSYARTLPFAGPGQDGYLFGRRVNTPFVYADVLSTGSLQVGAYGDAGYGPQAVEINEKVAEATFGHGVELTTGVHLVDIEGSWNVGGGRIVMLTDAPLPALLRSITLQAESEP